MLNYSSKSEQNVKNVNGCLLGKKQYPVSNKQNMSTVMLATELL